MNKAFYNVVLLVCISLVFVNCANRGTPDGGPKDEIPPKILEELPKNFNTNFKGKIIKIYFDEYVKMKDIQKQLIISPPMTTQPEITPLGGASKYITIKIFDTLQPNTTYAFNFGNSIVDNNEGNPYPYYRYVFSTGSYIDSLSVKGNIVDALKRQPETFVNVALYEVDSTFTDSIVYQKKPKYITNTLDSVTTFSIENIKAGKYMLMALKDGNSDNKFQQKTDQIAFHKSFITVPTDSLYTLKLFSEALDFKAVRPALAATQKIAVGYEGDYTKMKIKVKSELPPDFKYRTTKDEKKDTLYFWYKPKLEVDSLILNVSHTTFDNDYNVKIRKQKKDSLMINANPSGTIGIDEPFKISGNIPFVNFDISRVNLIDKDSVKVDFTTEYDSITNTYAFNFKKKEEGKYSMMVLPEAFTDFFDNKNDTLQYSLSTRKASDFGFVRFTLVNAKYPLIVQLTNEKGDVKAEKYTTKPETIDFLNLQPSTYYIRVIHDTNGNGIFDTGSYLKKIQPEKASHFKEIEVRADWGYPETLEFTSE
ncbi:Ig-like domain-containing protein [Mariniflexile jejuense]|uniref:Ig-like domain-containing protein n=1 Tax=Mariniflexile jejuense TaxID=1173582 RepID=A0ABW3JIQ4_9FLAO